MRIPITIIGTEFPVYIWSLYGGAPGGGQGRLHQLVPKVIQT